MEDLNEVDLKLFFDEEIYFIKESSNIFSANEAIVAKVNEPTPEPYKVTFKGGNNKGIGIIINETTQEFLNQDDETLLTNILKAIGLSFEDIALINQHHAGTEWPNQVNCSKVFLFGIKPADYNLSTALYELTLLNNAQWLFSNTLAEIGKDKVLKGLLWVKLQEVFPK